MLPSDYINRLRKRYGFGFTSRSGITYVHRCSKCHSELQKMETKHGWKCPECGREVSEHINDQRPRLCG